MQAFHLRYRNSQGTLMRILNAAARRGLDLASVEAAPAEHDHQVTMSLEANPKQVGQLYREWNSIADVMQVRLGAAHSHPWTSSHPPVSVTADETRAVARA